MTTIATDGKTIAADSRTTGMWIGQHEKIFGIGDSLFGVAGAMSRAMKVVDWLAAGCPAESRPETEDDFAILQLSGKGIWIWDSTLRPVQMGTPYAAIGSGAPFALGAMLAGKSPRQAVEIAAKLDECTGPPIISVRLPRSRDKKP